MNVISRMGRIRKLGFIENGCLFKLNDCYYIASRIDDSDNRRLCVNVESGDIVPIIYSEDVETLDYATIELTGRG